MAAHGESYGCAPAPTDVDSTTVRLTPEQAAHVSAILWLDLDEVRSPNTIEDIHRLRDELAITAQRLPDGEDVKAGRRETVTAPLSELLGLADLLMEAGADMAASTTRAGVSAVRRCARRRPASRSSTSSARGRCPDGRAQGASERPDPL